ncbi:putative regulator of Ras-like GTPase activity (Roadblock/LC7/MglB family) [Saccharothrix ecbatanensis]|jgi:predicted regulator of Ras-like GTPase activity (Roadblock/LC7/MglB family)|uniref:Putative regulator of Ras-like GTPase activity (Roadblock/LC7/MglB family) n=1 Tax=Saccharothrix ecbatanensis TaxID=1105145 RepID=A0A7W9HM28_9PSEU|nr:roadblock/LC7 domain-containing protein [Saccharothrix ecbatanensis]MBB5804398.1 putative regulator of Ras-like GTPase activity (Roadblock/LC7/MglB family) [Saccharothrix ecbatanensis]
MSTQKSRQVDQFGWLVGNFADRVPGVAHAVVISVDGLLLTASSGLPDDRADQLAAIAAGVASLTESAARCFDGGGVLRSVVEMQYGIMLLMSIRDGSCLAVLAAPDADVGQVAYEMTVVVDQVGQLLTPELRAQLHGAKRMMARPSA